MALDPMLFKKFHKPGSDVPVPPRPASPPPAKEPEPEKDIVEVLEEGGFKVAFDIPAREPTVEGRGNAPETQAEIEAQANELAESGYPEEAEVLLVEEPIDSKEVTVFVEPATRQDAGPVFKDRLDMLDSLVSSELGISPYTIDVIRSHVKHIMMDLVTQPELDSILIDRDVHNVLAFIRHVKVDAAEARTVTKVKKETKVKKDSKFRNFDIDFTALSNALTGSSGIPKSLTDLSKLK